MTDETTPPPHQPAGAGHVEPATSGEADPRPDIAPDVDTGGPHQPGDDTATRETPEALAEVGQTLRRRAGDLDLYVWDGLPEDNNSVLWDGTDITVYLDIAHQLGARVVYNDEVRATDGTLVAVFAMYAVEGVQHWFSTTAPATGESATSAEPGPFSLRALIRLLDTPDANDKEGDDGDGEGDDSEPPSPADLARSPYVSYASGSPREVTGQLRELVDRIVADPAFDHDYRHDNDILRAALEPLDPADAADVRYVVGRVFNVVRGAQLDADAKQLAPRVMALPAYHPLLPEADVAEIVAAHLEGEATGTDPRVIRRVVAHTTALAWSRGLHDEAERDMVRQATAFLDRLPAQVRDQVGFAHRTAARRSMLEPYLDDVDPRLRDQFVSYVRGVEEKAYARSREARYATAARGLTARGKSRSAASRILGVSSAVLNRIEAAHPRDVTLAPDDPILERAPELRP